MTQCSRILLLATALTACTSAGQSVTDFYTSFDDTYCAAEVACDRQPDDATCKLALSNVTTSDQATLIADVNAGIVKFDAAAANACLDQLMAAPCEHANDWVSCLDAAFTGTVPNGGACFAGGECVSQTCEVQSTSCDPSTTCCPGTCVADPRIALGAACNANPSCVDGAFCDVSFGVCVPLVATAGAACDATTGTTSSCVGPLVCIPDGPGAETGTCLAPAAEGATCSIYAPIACSDSRDYCSTTTRKCTPQAGVGLACSSDVPCQGVAICTNGVCVEKSAPGAACTPSTTDNACLGLVQCVGGVCAVAQEPAGSSCR